MLHLPQPLHVFSTRPHSSGKSRHTAQSFLMFFSSTEFLPNEQAFISEFLGISLEHVIRNNENYATVILMTFQRDS